MQLLLFKNFTKRINSTKRPDITQPDRNVTISAKDIISVEHPTFKVSNVDLDINYAYFNGKYYYVDDISLSNLAIYELHCSMDHLATYKDQIQSSSQYVLYASSGYNKFITDPRVLPTTEKVVTKTEITPLINAFSSTGTFIVGIIDNNAPGLTGVVTYYAMTDTELNHMMNEINGTSYIQTFLNNIQYAFANPMDAIVSCVWVPISMSNIPGNSGASITLINTPVVSTTAKRVTSPQFTTGATIGGYRTNQNYLDLEPYVTHSLYLPFVGNVPLDLGAVYPNDMNLIIAVDLLTGHIGYKLADSVTGSQGVISTYSAQCGVNIPLSNQTLDSTGILAGVLTTIGGVIATVSTGGAGAAAAIAGGAFATSKSAEMHSSINGAISSRLGAFMGLTIIKTTIVSKPSETFGSSAASRGLPLFNRVSLSGLSGYVQCQDASVDIPGNSADKETINSSLNSGIYIE